MTLRIGIIPTNGRDCVDRAVASLLHQVEHLLVLESGIEVSHREYPEKVTVLREPSGEINISKWWNYGLQWAQDKAQEAEAATWDVAIINDDVEVPPTWLCYIADDMRTLGCVAACSGGSSTAPVIQRRPGVVGLFNRLQGFAFTVAGESGIRADENFRWYYSDDMLGIIAAQMGGMVMFPGCRVTHRYPNLQVSPAIHAMIAEDAAKFHNQWGALPS